MAHLHNLLGTVVVLAPLWACADEVPCVTQGAIKTKSGCGCPEGTRFVQDPSGAKSECVEKSRVGMSAEEDGQAVRDASADGSVPVRLLDATVVDRPDGTTADSSEDIEFGPAVATCDNDGELRCAKAGTGMRQRCESGRWADAEPCADDEVCDGSEDKQVAVECRALLDVCKGNSDRPACDGSLMQFCGKSGVPGRSMPCESERQCQIGLAHGACAPCLPGSFHCKGAMLEKCSEDGQSFAPVTACSSAALCNEQAGACTAAACTADSKTCKGDILQTCNDTLTAFVTEETCAAGLCDAAGKQCDECVPNTKSCEAGGIKTCKADGQGYTTTACPSAKSICTGKGVCVECATASDCPRATECSVAMCNAASGICTNMFQAAGATCSVGICDGKGGCGPRPICGDGIKNQPSEECDDGNRIELDDCLNNCKEASCGDGLVNMLGTRLREECDPAETRADRWKCRECKETTFYNACSVDAECSPGETCLGTCTKFCTMPGQFDAASGCPDVPAPMRQICDLNMTPYCLATGCTNDSDCPEDMRCWDYGGTNAGYTTACIK